MSLNFVNTETFLGNDIKGVPQHYSYVYEEDEMKYFFDIRELYKHLSCTFMSPLGDTLYTDVPNINKDENNRGSNPYTNKRFSEESLRDIDARVKELKSQGKWSEIVDNDNSMISTSTTSKNSALLAYIHNKFAEFGVEFNVEDIERCTLEQLIRYLYIICQHQEMALYNGFFCDTIYEVIVKMLSLSEADPETALQKEAIYCELLNYTYRYIEMCLNTDKEQISGLNVRIKCVLIREVLYDIIGR